MPEPVTESLVVHWHPTARYHLHRLDLLADAKAEDLLREFRVTPDEVGVRADTAQVTMRESGVSLHPRGSLLGGEALSLLRSAFRCASPPEYHFILTVQFLIPITNQTYDEARLSALNRLSFGSLGAYDFSMLIDGRGAHNDWHCEFGIVSDNEVEPRLRRWESRMRDGGNTMPSFVDIPSNLAPVSFFADLVWVVPNRDGRDGESVNDIAEHVQELRDESKQMVSELYARVAEGNLHSLSKGSES